MKFALYLFDADHTLFDFDESERRSFTSCLAEIGIDLDPFTLLLDYQRISRRLWAMLEKGELKQAELKVRRFAELFELHKLTHDPVQISSLYLATLPRHPVLLPGALEVVRTLSQTARIGIVTNGIGSVQHARLAASEISPFIEFMVVSEECGFAKPDPRIFDHTLSRAGHTDRASVLMIGDRLETDIEGARRAGIAGCWYNPARVPRPAGEFLEVHALPEILAL